MKMGRIFLASAGLLAASVVPAISVAASEPRVVVATPLVTTVHARAAHGTLAINVVLRPSHPVELQRLVDAVNNPSSPQYRHFLRRGDFARRFAPSASALAAVRAYFRSFHVHLDAPRDGGLVVTARGQISDLSRALSTHFVQRHVGSRWQTLVNTPASVPLSLSRVIAAVTGISGERVHTSLVAHSVPTVTSGCSGAQPSIQSGGAWSPQAEAAGYGLTSQWAAGNTGVGQTIALYELAAYRNSDITAYANCFGITPSVSTVTVDGGAGPFDPATGAEPTLDLQEIIAMSPGAHVIVYLGPNNDVGPTDVYAQMAADDSASIISSSWGICESQLDQSAEVPIFQQMVAQGQSLIAASGDSGSADCYDSSNSFATSVLAVDDPAGQPTVTGVGGLSVTSFSPLAASVWNDGIGTTVGSGGGFSQTFATPAWQQSALVASGALSLSPTTCGVTGDQTCRAVPDISVVGDPSRGFLFRYQGSWGGIGGTSIGSPLVASIIAVASQNCGVTTGFGNLNTQLYAMNTSGGGLIDITRGNNDTLGLGAFDATVGYDPASGLGTIDPATFYNAICPLVASATNSTVSAPSSLTVHGAPGTLSVTARNFANALMTTVTPVVSVTPATGLIVGNAVSVSAGRSTFALSATQAGTYQLSIVVAGRNISTSTITVGDAVAVARTSSVTASTSSTSVDGAPLIVSVTPRTYDGTVITTLTPTLTSSPSSGLAVSSTTSNGTTTFTVSPTQAGTVTLSVQAGNVALATTTLTATSPFPAPVSASLGLARLLSYLPAVDALSSSGTLYIAGRGAQGHLFLATASGSSTIDLTSSQHLPTSNVNPALSCAATCSVAINAGGSVVVDLNATSSPRVINITATAKQPMNLMGVPTISALPTAGQWLVTWRNASNHLMAATVNASGLVGTVRDVTSSIRATPITGAPSAITVGAKIIVATRTATSSVLDVWSAGNWRQVVIGSAPASTTGTAAVLAMGNTLTVALPTSSRVSVFSVDLSTLTGSLRATVTTATPTHYTSGLVGLVAGTTGADVIVIQSGSLVLASGTSLDMLRPLAPLVGLTGAYSLSVAGAIPVINSGSVNLVI